MECEIRALLHHILCCVKDVWVAVLIINVFSKCLPAGPFFTSCLRCYQKCLCSYHKCFLKVSFKPIFLPAVYACQLPKKKMFSHPRCLCVLEVSIKCVLVRFLENNYKRIQYEASCKNKYRIESLSLYLREKKHFNNSTLGLVWFSK